MADVTGQIIGSDGTKDVRLNNAATEATLKALLANSSIDTALLKQIASKAGIDNVTLNNLSEEAAASSVSIRRATASTEQLTTSQNKLREHSQLVDNSFYGLIESAKLLASGNSSVSGVLTLFKGLPGPIGLVAQGFAKLAEFQEKNMLTYQSMSSAGANFGGSLTDMRLAAQGSFVTLEQFGNLVKNNSQVLGRMGGTVDDGTRAFAAMSNSLMTSKAGESLLSLGYTTEDVNQGMLSYIATSGGRTKEEMKNTQAITAATAEYMTELDKLTQFTGVNRKQLEEDQKKAAAQQAFQRKLASLGEEERAKLKAAYDAASASGIAGATDAVMSAALGMPPLTKEAQQLAGTLPDAYNGLTKMTNSAMTVGTSMDDIRQANGEFVMGAVHGAEQLGATGDALSLQGNQTINGAIGLQNQMNSKGIKSAEEYAKSFKDIGDNQKTQSTSQAAAMAKADIQLKEFGLAIMKLISPIISILTPALQYIGPLFLGLGAAVMGYKASLIALETFERAKQARALATSTGGGVLATAKNFLGGGAANTAASTLAGGAAKTAAGGAARAAVSGAGELIPGGAATSSGGGILGKVLGGLADGLKQLGDPKVMLGIVSVGLLGGAMMIAGKAFKEFTGINWGDVLIGSIVLTGLAVGASALVGIAPFIGITAVAIGLLGAAIWVLAKGLKEFPTMAIPGMSEAFEGFGKIVGTVFDFVGGIITGLIDTVKTVFGTVWDVISWPFKQIGNLLSGAASVITGIFGTIWDVVSWPFKQLGNLLSGTVTMMKNIFGTVWDIISWPFKQLGNLLSGTVDVITGIFGTIWDVISWPFKQLGNLLSGTINVITGIFGTIWDVVSWPFKQLGNLISGTVGVATDIFKGMVAGISVVFGTVWDIISWPFKQIGNLLLGTVNVITGIFGTIWNIISWPFKQLGNLVSGTIDGITSVFTGMVAGISAIFGTIWNIISSPFKLIGDLVSGTVNVISSVFGTVWDILSSPFKMIGALVSTVFDGISGAIKFVIDKLSNILGMIGSVIKGVAGFVGRLFGGGGDKDEKGGSGLSSPEFTKATSVLFEAANKLNVVGDKLIAGAGLGGKGSSFAGPSSVDSVLSSTSLNKAMSDIKQKALGLPPMTENAKKLAANEFEEKGPSLAEKTHTELVSLNSTMKDLLRYIKDTADNTKRTHEATKNLNGNAFAI